jgi:hypothetical protein
VDAADLRLGDVTWTSNGPQAITGIIRDYRSTTVYNLGVSLERTYLVGESGVLVHNKTPDVDMGGGGALPRAYDAAEANPLELPGAGTVRAAKRGQIEWVNEGHGNPAAAAYEAGAPGHVPGKAPRLSATDAEGTVTVKFDGVDGATMVDRKMSVTTFPKSERQMLRQSATAAENGYGVRWEVPTAAEQARAQKMAESLGVKNIDVQVKP